MPKTITHPGLIALRDFVRAGVAGPHADLTMRQLSVLLTVGTEPGPHTVRGLAGQHNISKPAVTRALDRLQGLDLTRRAVDPMDRRSVLVTLTGRGDAYVRGLAGRLEEAGLG